MSVSRSRYFTRRVGAILLAASTVLIVGGLFDPTDRIFFLGLISGFVGGILIVIAGRG